MIITFFPHSLPRPLHSPIVCLRLPGEGFHTSKGPIAGGKRRNLLSVGKTKASTSTIRSKISKDSIRTQFLDYRAGKGEANNSGLLLTFKCYFLYQTRATLTVIVVRRTERYLMSDCTWSLCHSFFPLKTPVVPSLRFGDAAERLCQSHL